MLGQGKVDRDRDTISCVIPAASETLGFISDWQLLSCSAIAIIAAEISTFERDRCGDE